MQLLVAFAAIYLIWGSTYLAIRFAIDTIPPFLMAGFRFILGGLLLFVWSRRQGTPMPTAREMRHAAVVGLFMMVGGTGGVTWAEQFVPSGLTALLVATVPLWIVLFDWLRPHGQRPSWLMWLGLSVGTVGMALLVVPGRFAGADHVNLLGAGVLIVACASWATGSIYSRHAPLPKAQTMSAAMQLFAGAIAMLALSLVAGEWRGFDVSQISGRSIVSFFYLAVFGTLAFAAYIWLLRASTPAKAATYAYVNPVVAIALGSMVGGEPFQLRTLISAAVICVAVALIITAKTIHPAVRTSPVSESSGTPVSPCSVPSTSTFQK
jgi:drug/metabolite transporter (DMT)-like permease